MPAYIVLGKYTKEGLGEIEKMVDIVAKHRKNIEAKGIRLIGTWATMGQYDYVSVYEAPDDATMAVMLLNAARSGLMTSQTMRAFSEDELKAIVAKID